MKQFALSIIALMMTTFCWAQKPLPARTFVTMRDSTNAMDIVFYLGKGGSLSLDGKNVHTFNYYFENASTQKTNLPQAGSIMWQINGREYLSGVFFLGDSTGYVVTNKDGIEYVNRVTTQGTAFLKSQIKH